MSDGFEISTDGLRAHVAQIRGSASDIDSARATADATMGMVSGGAFGLMCAWMAPIVQGRIATLSSQISEFATAERNAAGQLEEAAGAFEQTESQLQQAIDSMVRGLDA